MSTPDPAGAFFAPPPGAFFEPYPPERPKHRAAPNLPPLPTYGSGDFDLTIDAVYALRKWRLGPDGLLHPVAWGVEPWRPGINEAVCHAELQELPLLCVGDPTDRGRHAAEIRSERIVRAKPEPLSAARWATDGGPTIRRQETETVDGYKITWHDGSSGRYTADELPLAEAIPRHETPGEFCTCGFYAYNSQVGDYIANPVQGVVRLTGRILVGTKGYRAQKGEVVALLEPTDAVNDKARLVYGRSASELLREAFPDVPILPDQASLLAEFPLSKLD